MTYRGNPDIKITVPVFVPATGTYRDVDVPADYWSCMRNGQIVAVVPEGNARSALNARRCEGAGPLVQKGNGYDRQMLEREAEAEQYEGPTCSICDAVGHGYPGAGPCPLEDNGRTYDPREM